MEWGLGISSGMGLACMMGNGMEVSMHDGQWHGG